MLGANTSIPGWPGNERKNEPKIRLTNPVGSDCMKCHKEKPSHTRSLAQAQHGNGPAGHAVRPRPGHAGAGPSDSQGLEARGERPARSRQPIPRRRRNTPGRTPAPSVTTHRKKATSSAAGGVRSMPRPMQSLGTPAARVIAAKMGIAGDPQTSTSCLKCHATAYHRASAGVAETYSILEGVGCEACHGAGSAYAPEDVMKDRSRAIKSGLLTVDKSTCLACHEQAHGKPFDYDTAWKMIAHPAQAPRAPRRSLTRRRSIWRSGQAARNST